MERIEPGAVYGQFRGVPVGRDIELFRDILTKNLTKAVLYIRARLLAVATVAAFATLTGGCDAPKSFFFGDLPSFHTESERLGDGLLEEIPESLPPPPVEGLYNPEIYELLRGNRMSETGFDTRNAPLAAYMYNEFRNDQALEKFEKLYECPLLHESSWKLLTHLPLHVACTIGGEVGRIAISRRKAINRILNQLEKASSSEGNLEVSGS